MKKYLFLAKLQIKAAFLSLPRIIGGTIVLTFLVILVGIGGTKMMKSDSTQEKIVVAIVSSESESAYINQAFLYLEQIESVKNICTFVKMEDSQAAKGLQEGSVTAIIRIPENFVDDIMVGINTPAEIVFLKRGVNNSSMLFQELVTAAASDLSTAQAGIYSVDDACRSLGISRQKLKVAENDMNSIYLAYIIERGTYFASENLASTGELQLVQFYVCTGIVMLLILSGIVCVELLKKDNQALSIALKRENIHSGIFGAFKVLGVTIVFFCIGAFLLTMTMLASIRFPALKNILSGTGPLTLLLDYLGLFVLIYGVFSFVYFIYRLAANPVYGVVMLFVLGMLMMFASGCFMPSALLPRLVQNIGEWLPAAWYFKLSAQLLIGKISFECLIINVIYLAVFLGGAALQERWSR
ncbi:MAG: ABC transporter permease [Eubacteriales bacterium]|nr:ABC transporter permease [Eubacteriales bacterium]